MDSIISKANKKLGIITHVFRKRDSSTFIPLYKTFVRPLLEYNSVIWSPITTKYNDKLEKVQKKMFRLMSDLRDLNYQEKLAKANILSLRARRILHQLITMFKMKNNLNDLRFEDFFEKNSYGKTRGNKYKLVAPKFKSSKHKNFFTNDCVRHWNRLKSSDIEVRSCGLFKNKIMEYFIRENTCIW